MVVSIQGLVPAQGQAPHRQADGSHPDALRRKCRNAPEAHDPGKPAGPIPPMKARAPTAKTTAGAVWGNICRHHGFEAAVPYRQAWDVGFACHVHARSHGSHPGARGRCHSGRSRALNRDFRTATTAACSIGLSAWVNAIQHKPFEGSVALLSQPGCSDHWVCLLYWPGPACLVMASRHLFWVPVVVVASSCVV